MNLSEITQWVIASVLWFLALIVFIFNIRRQETNQKYYQAGSDKRVSGIAFLCSIFIWLGVAVSPLAWSGYWLFTLLLEIPGMANFISDPKGSE